jgi:hypothetical protein
MYTIPGEHLTPLTKRYGTPQVNESSFADVIITCLSPSTLHICIEISVEFKKEYGFRNNSDRLGFQQYSDYTSVYIIQFFVQVYSNHKK